MMGGSRITRLVIFTLLGVECVVMLVVLVICARFVLVLPKREHLSICIPTGVPRYFWMFYIPPLVFETVLFCLALGASVYHLRQKCLWDGRMVINVLIRDSVFYFMVAEIVYVANAATAFYIAHYNSGYIYVPWMQIPQGAALVITCIIVSRLILNLQDVYYLPVDTPGVVSTLIWREQSILDFRVEDCDVLDIASDRPLDEVLDISNPDGFDTRNILEIHRPRPVSVS
ncbi:hypothetical protein BDZ89DRAFT_1055648 [Hymenopellis radicata]|nr:hypothetical protein BDZ89DRAFT_1055648 [Hymenopellis radicata]